MFKSESNFKVEGFTFSSVFSFPFSFKTKLELTVINSELMEILKNKEQ